MRKGSYKFFLLYLFVFSIFFFIILLLLFRWIIVFAMKFWLFDFIWYKKEAGRKREKKFGEIWRKKILLSAWNLIRKYKNNPGCWYIFQSQLSVLIFLNEISYQLVFLCVRLLHYFSVNIFSIQVTQRNCRVRPGRQLNSHKSFWSR